MGPDTAENSCSMSKYQYQSGPEEVPEVPVDREKELSGQFDDPGFDFIFDEEIAS